MEPALLLFRQTGRPERLDDAVRNVELRTRKRWDLSLPAQTRTHVIVQTRRPRQLVGTPVEVSNLIEERLELTIVESHAHQGTKRDGQLRGPNPKRSFEGLSAPSPGGYAQFRSVDALRSNGEIMGTNTTALIRAWSMDGAERDASGDFGSALDLNAALSKRDPEEIQTEVESAPERPPLLLKGADDDDWRPLVRSVDTD